MGVYSQFDRYVAESANGETYADESYFGIAGAYQAMEESSINAHSIFEAIIGRDFAEAEMQFENSAISESDMEMINEAVGSGVWTKVKEFVQKVWNKLLGILKSIKDRIVAVFTRDGKELVNKFSKQIKQKLNTGKLSKFKWKQYEKTDANSIASLPGDTEKCVSEISGDRSILKIEYDKMMKDALGNKNVYDKNTDKESDSNTMQNIAKGKDTSGNDANFKPYTSEKKTEMLEQTLAASIGVAGEISKKDYPKEFEEKFLGDLEEKDSIDSTVISAIEDELKNGKRSLENINKAEKRVNDQLKTWKKEAENVEKQVSKNSYKNEYAAKTSKYASNATACVSLMQEASSAYFAAYIACTKKSLKNARSTYIKAATFNQKGEAYEEQAALMEAVEEVSDYEVEEMFAAY